MTRDLPSVLVPTVALEPLVHNTLSRLAGPDVSTSLTHRLAAFHLPGATRVLRRPVLLLAMILVHAVLAFHVGRVPGYAGTPDPSPADSVTSLIADPEPSPQIGNRIPLILIHGAMSGTESSFDRFVEFFQASDLPRAYKIYRFAYTNNIYPVWELARSLRNRIDALIDQEALLQDGSFNDGPLVLLGHSMGGLVARSYMAEHSHNTGVYDGTRGGERILNSSPWRPLITDPTPPTRSHGSAAWTIQPGMDWPN